MDTGAWWATVHGIAKSQSRLSDKNSLTHTSFRNTDLIHLLNNLIKLPVLSRKKGQEKAVQQAQVACWSSCFAT